MFYILRAVFSGVFSAAFPTRSKVNLARKKILEGSAGRPSNFQWTCPKDYSLSGCKKLIYVSSRFVPKLIYLVRHPPNPTGKKMSARRRFQKLVSIKEVLYIYNNIWRRQHHISACMSFEYIVKHLYTEKMVDGSIINPFIYTECIKI